VIDAHRACLDHGKTRHSFRSGRGLSILVLSLGLLTSLGCKPDLHSGNWVRRAEAVGRVTDQAQLAAIAVRDQAEPVCLMAVAGLTDQESLGVVAFGSPNSRVQIAAVQKLTDPTLLASLAEPGRHINTRIAVIGRLENPSVLDAIAHQDSDSAVREAAASRLAVLQGTNDIEGE
jgi:hypothetical protein